VVPLHLSLEELVSASEKFFVFNIVVCAVLAAATIAIAGGWTLTSALVWVTA
jgi:hypothetical protein